MAEKPLSDEEIKQFRLEKARAAYKPDPRDPAQEMKDAGFTAFTAKGQHDLEIMKNRYTGDFRAFFASLSDKYEGKGRTKEINRINDVLSQIDQLTFLIDKLLKATDPKASILDVKLLSEMVKGLDAEFVFFTNANNITQVLSENIESVGQTTGVNIEDLKRAQGMFSRKTKELTKPPTMLNQILPGMPELHRGIRRFGEGILASATLPFYPGIKTARDIDKERAARKQTLEDREFASAGINVAPDNALPTFASPMAAGIGREGIIPPRLSARSEGASSAYQPSGIQDDLFSFFNTRAYHAKWTKELLESAGRVPLESPDKKDRGAGLLDAGIMGSLARLIGPILGVLAAAQGGWMIGRWIGENVKIGGKSVDKHIEGFAQHAFFGGDEKDQLKKIAKDKNLDPVVRRSVELMAADPKLNPVKASEMAQQEWAGRTRLDIGGKPDIEATNIAREKAGLPPIGTPKSKTETLGAKAVPGEKTAMPENVWADPTSGMFVAIDPKTQQEFFGATAEEAAGERAKAQGMKSAAAAGLGVTTPASAGVKTTPKVPIDNTQAEIDKEQKASLDKLDATITEMSDTLKESSKGKTQPKNSGYDANNTRNPVLSSIGAGQITS